MKKRIIAIFICIILVLSISGCNKSNTDTNSVSSSSDKDSSKNSVSGSKNDSSNNSNSSSKNNDGKSSNMNPSNNSSSNSSNNNSDTSNTVQEKPDTRIIVEGGEAEFEAAVDKLVAEKYPELKKLKDQGLIGIKAEPGKDIIKLGSWDLEYTENFETKTVKKTLEWEVLKYSDDGKSALVVSKYLICRKAYNDEETDITWENCTLRAWLNDEFYNGAFSLSEQSLIQKNKVVNEDNTNSLGEVMSIGGNDTEDYLFLLSLTEARTLFDVDEEYHNGGNFRLICACTNDIAENWWLRSPGYNSSYAALVLVDGGIWTNGGVVDVGYRVRPAFWINLTPEIIKSNYLSIGGYQTLSESDVYVKIGDWNLGQYGNFDEEKREKLEWAILDYDKDDGKVLLISRYLMQLNNNYDERYGLRYNDEDIDITWENCSLRSRLNSDFYNKAFSDSERKLINKSLIKNEDNDKYATAGGNDTEDYVFLLSLSEVDKYFEAEKRGDTAISRICSYKAGYVEEWWLRSPGDRGSSAAYVSNDGRVSDSGHYFDDFYGVRPALWLNLNP